MDSDWCASQLDAELAQCEYWPVSQSSHPVRSNRHMPSQHAKRATKEQSQDEIIEATIAELRQRRGGDVTMDAVAKRAGCAKGLVHYHFKRKDQLLAAVAKRMWEARGEAWRQALARGEPKSALAAAWRLVGEETSSGSSTVCAALGMRGDELVVQSVNSGRSAFARTLGEAVRSILDRMGLESTVPVGELGTLLAATAEGIELQLGGGADRRELEQAWAAFWVGLLALTRPGRT